MLTNKTHRMTRGFIAAMALAITGFVIGCGQSPISSQDTLNDQVPVRLAKPGGQMHTTTTSTDAGIDENNTSLYVQSDFKNFKAGEQGQIQVNMPQYGDAHTVQLKKAIFEVPKGALGSRNRITMTCYSGTTIDDVNVVFDPAGLTFAPHARLTLYLRGPVTAEDVMHVQHIYGSGQNVEAIYTETSQQGESFLIVVFDIPGFSRYSLGGDY